MTAGRRLRPRIIGAALGATLAAGLLAACSSGSSSGSSSGALKLWVRQGTGGDQAVAALLAPFKAANPNVKIDVFTNSPDFETKLSAAAAAHNLPDIVIDDAAQLGNFENQGIIQEIPKDQISVAGDITDVAWSSTADIKGKNYGLPVSAQADIQLIRSDWLKKLNLSAPTTWDQFETVVKDFTTKDPDGNGKNDTYGMTIPGITTRGYIGWNWYTYLWQAGGDFFTKGSDGKLTSAINSTQAVAAATYYEKLMCTDKVAQPGYLNQATGDAQKFWINGQSGSYLTGPYLYAPSDAGAVKGKYEAIVPMTGPANNQTLAEGTTAYLMAGTKHKADAMKLLNYFVTPDAQKLAMNSVATITLTRLPVNKTVTVASVRGSDPRWATAEKTYANSPHYEPQYLPNWQAFRLEIGKTMNSLLSSCGDPKAALDTLNTTFTDLLKKQGVLAGS